MKAGPDIFFLRGGFSSSQWNYAKPIDYADIEESLCENEPIPRDFDLFVRPNKSKLHRQRSLCGVSA